MFCAEQMKIYGSAHFYVTSGSSHVHLQRQNGQREERRCLRCRVEIWNLNIVPIATQFHDNKV